MSWYLEVPSGEIIFKNSSIKNCSASGGANFIAYTALGNEDLGSNEGIDFEAKAYWVGNTDESWITPENWAYISGGQTKLETAPNSQYDIYFDSNSSSEEYFYVFINDAEFEYECKNLYCDTTSLLIINISKTLSVFGEYIDLNENINFEFEHITYNDIVSLNYDFSINIKNNCSLKSLSETTLPPIYVNPMGE